MRVLLLHPEDNFRGPWARQRWDRIVDLGRAPKAFYHQQSAALGCEVSSIYDLAREVDDLKIWRPLLALGVGRIIDRSGLDWWSVIAPLLQQEMQSIHLALRQAEQIGDSRTLAVTRPSILAEAMGLQLGIPLRVLQPGIQLRVTNRAARYRTALANLSYEQLRQVIYDKYDPSYRWRRKFANSSAPSSDPVVLLPSAYSNVTKTALQYAQLLPEQQFLLVLARESAAVDSAPANVRTVPLAAFADGHSGDNELRELEDRWTKLEHSLSEQPEFNLSVRLGVWQRGLSWLRWGVPIRNAWRNVFEAHSVIGFLCADDTNPYTRIASMLAQQRAIPAVACHHGALDYAMAFKAPCFDVYLAKGDMERNYLESICGMDPAKIVIGAPSSVADRRSLWRADAPWIVFFTEPYEVDLWRTEEVYRELLPRLCAAAKASGKTLVLKLHPFESVRQRRRLVQAVLNKNDQRLVTVIDTRLSDEILSNTWCAVTVESTVAFECASVAIPAFLCGWMRNAYAGYAPQFARYGAGLLLDSPDALLEIPRKIAGAAPRVHLVQSLVQPILPATLSDVLTGARLSRLR